MTRPLIPAAVLRRAEALADRLLARQAPPVALEPSAVEPVGPAAVLNQTFADFATDAHVVGSTVGPVVTCWHVRPGPNVKVEKVESLQKTIESRLESAHIRITHVVPGAGGVMGIEVPNVRRSIVALPDLLAAAGGDDPLLVALGTDVAGRPVFVDLSTLPHIMIAGETGAGKSSVINNVLCSVLSRMTPDEVRLLLIDPKRVELAPYAGIPHLLAPIVTEPAKAVDTLEWLCGQMDDRFERLRVAGVRNISEYNRRVPQAERMARILTVIDELADLMIVAKDDVEGYVVRLSQLARAAGIHLVLATQRPSVNVVTGLIKANMPARLALRAASLTDSRVILDEPGAEKLLGAGDALLRAPGMLGLQRIQCAWVTDEEIAEVVAVARTFGTASGGRVEPEAPSVSPGAEAALLELAVDLVVTAQFGSTNMLQRKLRVGHAKAGALIDRMESLGVVGPADGSKARDVLIQPGDLPALLARLRAA